MASATWSLMKMDIDAVSSAHEGENESLFFADIAHRLLLRDAESEIDRLFS